MHLNKRTTGISFGMFSWWCTNMIKAKQVDFYYVCRMKRVGSTKILAAKKKNVSLDYIYINLDIKTQCFIISP